MWRVPVFVLTALMLLFGSTAADAQHRPSEWASARPRLSLHEPQPVLMISLEPVERRPWWVYPAAGVVAGALVGGLWWQHTIENAIDYHGPVLWPYTAAAGAGVGFLLGVVANGIHPR